MVFQYGYFGARKPYETPVANLRDRNSLLGMGAPWLADMVASLNTDLETRTKERDGARNDLSVRTQERDQAAAALNVRTQERDQNAAVANARTQERDVARIERDQARNERESFRQQAGRIPTLEKSILDLSAVANLVPALQQQVARIPALEQQAGRVPVLEKSVADLSAVANRVPGLEQQAGRVPMLEQTVRDLTSVAGRVPMLERSVQDLSLVAQQVPGLKQQISAVAAERDGLSVGLKNATAALGAEQEKSRNFERAASGLKMQADALSLDLANVNKVLAKVQANFEASQAEAAKLSAGLQSERSARLAAEGTAEARTGELSVAKTALAEALAGKDLALADAARQWKGELDSALKAARESLEAEREVARGERNAVEEQRKSLGEKYEELLKKYNTVLAELEAERSKSCPVCPVCQDCPAPQPCPECGKASTQSASTESGSSAWTLLLALGGGYLVGKNLGK